MKRIAIFLTGFFLTFSCLADEGMWLPINITQTIYGTMRGLGMELTAEQIYSVNNASIKDAVVSLGGFCTGEIISRQGLLLTNHHCAESSIQSHSSVEKDYLTDGFWAQTMEDELPNPGLYVRFLVRMDDVTKQVLSNVKNDMTEPDTKKAISENVDKIVKEAENETTYNAEVKPVFEGNKYYLFVYETYTDVRLVGAPPTSIGTFGGETDNWTWPRHTGDFALYRVYMSQDGKPAPYSPTNIPLKPKHHLPISVKGYSEHDFAMILGFSGSTRRYVTSYGLEMSVNQTNPDMINILQTRQDILKEEMKDEEVRIQYHSKFSSIGNALKYYRGQTQGIIDQQVIEQRKALEDQFSKWVQQKKKRQKEYGNAIDLIKTSHDSITIYNTASIYNRLTMRLIEILQFAESFSKVTSMLKEIDLDSGQVELTLQQIEPVVNEFYKDYHPITDQKVMASLFKLYKDNVPVEQQPEFLQQITDFDAWAADVFNASLFTSKKKIAEFLEDPVIDNIQKDTVYKISRSFMAHYLRFRNKTIKANVNLDKGNRLFVKGLMEMQPDKHFYPDANSTMRLSYGTVQGYSPSEDVTYEHFTTLEGVKEKYQPGDEEFDVPDKLLRLFEEKDFGGYAENNTMKVNFLSNNDITGGNSGSPVLNGRGELIGVAFDGNWEAMSSDIAYIPDLQRTINVDIRYVLFIIDKIGNAGHLIDEMDIVGKEMTVPAGQESR